MNRLVQTLKAFLVVFVSMTIGVGLTLAYVTVSSPSRLSGLVLPARFESPPSFGEASKATIFDEQQVMAVYEKAAPAVVAIRSLVGQRPGLGSGVLIDPSGIVLTNYHVVRNATQIEVALSDRTRYIGQVLGADPQNDLAVVRLINAPADLPAVPLGDVDALRPGALAIAIGNPGGLERSVTVGVVSGLNRTLRDTPARAPIRDVIQTDAAINQGNSGGPLLNRHGEIIGINTAIEVVNGQRGFGGIGFAVPVSTAARYLDRMIAGETIEHPWLGISGSDVTSALARERGLTVTRGVLIAETIAGGPAEAAGVLPGDVLVSIAGHPLDGIDALGERMDRSHSPGEEVTLGVVRGRQRLDLSVTIGKWPERLPPTR